MSKCHIVENHMWRLIFIHLTAGHLWTQFNLLGGDVEFTDIPRPDLGLNIGLFGIKK